MDSEEDDIIIASAAYILIRQAQGQSYQTEDQEADQEAEQEAPSEKLPPAKRTKTKRRIWMTPVLKSRQTYSGKDYEQHLKVEMEHGLNDNFCSMALSDFEWLLNLVGPKISKKNTYFREAVPPHERLLLTLRYLVTGESYINLMQSFKVSRQLISGVIPEVCAAIVEVLDDFVKLPSTAEQWLAVAEKFESGWQFPHCLGAIDGKQFPLHFSFNCTTEQYAHDQKKKLCLVLLGVVDADHCFLLADVGVQARSSDGGVFPDSVFWNKLHKSELNLPAMDILPGRRMKAPYVFLVDETFPLQAHVLKAYPTVQDREALKRIFNYRLRRAHARFENAFGSLSAVFGILRKPKLTVQPDTAVKVILACVHLHNFLRKRGDSVGLYTPDGTFDCDAHGIVTPGSWRTVLANDSESNSAVSNRKICIKAALDCEAVRTEFSEYFSGEGSVPWQNLYA